MYADILRSITGIAVFPVFSLLLFVSVFTAVLLWALRADAQLLARHAVLPLDPPTGDGAPAPAGAEPVRRAL